MPRVWAAVLALLPLLLEWPPLHGLLLQKCCPFSTALEELGGDGEELWDFRCVEFNNTSTDDLWWFNSSMAVYSSTNGETVENFLSNVNFSVMYPEGITCSPVSKLPSDEECIRFFDNGTLRDDCYIDSSSFPPPMFCADFEIAEGRYVFLMFPFKRCCNGSDVLTFKDNIVTCENAHKNNAPMLLDIHLPDASVLDSYLTNELTCHNCSAIVPQCKTDGALMFMASQREELTLYGGNRWGLQIGNPWNRHFCPETFCLDEVVWRGVHQPGALVCIPHRTTSSSFFPLLATVNVVLLSATALTPVVLPPAHSHISIVAALHCACLAVFNALFTITWYLGVLSSFWCFFFAFLSQFAFLAAFFWLNVISIDISWVFSGLRPLPGNILDRNRRKYIYYSLYAWGTPTFICFLTLLFEFVDDLPQGLIRPDIGVRTCWFYSKMASFAYFYGPITLLLGVNVCLFAFTAWKIVDAQRGARALQRSDSHRHEGSAPTRPVSAGDRQRLVLYAKLFCLMGLTWLMEVVAWAEGSDGVLWYVTDFLNFLRAVFIFIIFCCKRSVWRHMKRRWRGVRWPLPFCRGEGRTGGAVGSGGRSDASTVPTKSASSGGGANHAPLRLMDMSSTRIPRTRFVEDT